MVITDNDECIVRDINWGSARPFYGCKITWYLTHNDKVLVWRGDAELIRHEQVVIEDDEKPARHSFEQTICLTPRYKTIALCDAVAKAAEVFGLTGRINLTLDTKNLDHIVVNMTEEAT